MSFSHMRQKDVATHLAHSLPALSLSCPAEAEGYLFHPRGCMWGAVAVLEAVQAWQASRPCGAVAGSSQHPADAGWERIQVRPVWFSNRSMDSLWQTLELLVCLRKTV